MALRNAFGDLGLDSTLQAIRDRLPAALGGTGGVKVDVGSSALPSGAATSAKQDTGNTSLGNIDTSTAASKTDLDTIAGTVGSGKVNVNISSGGITGSKSNNAVAPGSTNLGVLPSVANAAAQSWTEGNQVSSSTDLKGNQRTRIQDAAGNDRGANVTASNELLVNVNNTPAVSGTVTANQGGTWDIRNVSGTVSLPTGAATSTKQSDGSQKTQVVDGSGNVIGSTANALDINIKSGNATTVTANAGTNLNTSALALDATLTNATQQTKITDGTNVASTLKSDGTAAGQNALMMSGTYLSVPFTTTTAQSVGTTDAGNYRAVSVQITSQGGSSTVSFQESNDNSNWVSTALVISTLTNGTSPANSSTTVNSYVGPVTMRYFRLNVTGIVSGTTAGTVVFNTMPFSPVGIPTTIIAGNKTNNNAVPGTNNLGVLPGLANAAQQTWTEGDQVHESMDLKGNQRMRISDAAGNDRGANVNASNQLSVSVDNTPAVNIIAGQTGVSAGVGASGALTQRVVQANDSGKTLVSAGGSAASSGNNTLVAAGTNKLKVYAFTLSTTSSSAVTCIFQSGAGGTELWRVVLQAVASTSTGANLVVQPPAWIFSTASATLLNLNLSAAQTVHWSVSYFDEA